MIVAKSLPYENSEHDWVTAAHVVVVVLELTVFPEAGVSGTPKTFLSCRNGRIKKCVMTGSVPGSH